MLQALVEQIERAPNLVVLTGAGISAPSGIPTYRNDNGDWQRSDPILHQQFLGQEAARRRYWARSMAGWRFVRHSQPNPAHEALAQMERQGHVQLLVTQNVDRLHQRAGQGNVIDLHGRVDRVICQACRTALDRSEMQVELERLNASLELAGYQVAPDGDAELDSRFFEHFKVPDCPGCQGMLMPDVVFFGGSVPRERVEQVDRAVAASHALLVVGSSLMVWSGFRICRFAANLGKPIFIINQGRTRADELATLKVSDDCVRVLPELAQRLGTQGTRPNPV
jgi:NAD-dependent SIR2 family protein deacetylase